MYSYFFKSFLKNSIKIESIIQLESSEQRLGIKYKNKKETLFLVLMLPKKGFIKNISKFFLKKIRIPIEMNQFVSGALERIVLNFNLSEFLS